MAQNIHPTAYIAEDVTLGDNITVGPFAVIETGAQLGENCQVGAHAVVHGFVKMGDGNILHPHAILGGLPQDTSFKPETVSWLICGDNNRMSVGLTSFSVTERTRQIGTRRALGARKTNGRTS